MNTKSIRLAIVALLILGVVGVTTAVVRHNHSVSNHNAMMRADAMKRAEAVKASDAAAAMKKEEAAKAAQAPAPGDAMVHESTPAAQ